MGEHQSPDLRIGDIERGEALRALGEHLSVGRLDADEYGERAARATAAKTRGEITQLFADLPQPHPRLDDRSPAPSGPHGESGGTVAVRGSRRPAIHRFGPPLVPLSGILAIALFFSVPAVSWLIFLVPAAVAVIVGTLQGEDRRRDRNR